MVLGSLDATLSETPLACLDADTAAAFAAHTLAPEESQAIEEHIDTCSACRELVSMVAKAGWSGSGDSSPSLGEPGGPQTVLPRGTRVGPFEIEQPLDAGGMGLVYAARDVRLDRPVALKCLRERRGSPEQLMREAKLMAQLASPNVVPVYDVIEAHGQVFIAMELVVGRSLRQWLEQGARSWKTVVDVFLAAGAGLASAHAAGIVHGDVKPANILLGDDGRARVTDFGLASLGSEGAGGEGTVRGTPAYLAPEQREGKPCDARADQYAFCVSLHEALFGALPGAPAVRSPGLPRGVRQVLARGLQVDPARRFPSMQALLAALHAARSPRWKQVLAAAAVLGAVGGLAFLVGGRKVEAAQCAGAASELASPWDAEARRLLGAAFDRTHLPYAADALAHVSANLDAWNDRFEVARARACEASWFRREVPLERLPAQLSCLEDRAREVRALVSQLRDADATVVLNSVSATEQLTPVSRCTESAPQRAAPRETAEVRKLREKFATTHALIQSGKFRDALPISNELMKAAEAAGDLDFTASARVNLGINQANLADYEHATQNLLEGIHLADLAQNDRLRAQAWVGLVQTEFWQGHFDKMVYLEPLALGACERLGDAWYRSELLLFTGGALTQLGKAREAQALFEEAVAVRTRIYGERDRRTSFALSSLGNALAMQGDLAGGIEAHRKALVAAEAALGPNHPNIGTLHGNLGSDYLYALKIDEALGEMEKSLAVAEATAPKQLKVALALTDLGLAELERPRPERALAYLEQANALWNKLSPKHPIHADALLGQYLALEALGRPAPVADLELAVELSKNLPPFERGRIQLNLARALPEKSSLPRAIALAREAEKGLASSTLPLVQRERAQAQAWLRVHGEVP